MSTTPWLDHCGTCGRPLDRASTRTGRVAGHVLLALMVLAALALVGALVGGVAALWMWLL